MEFSTSVACLDSALSVSLEGNSSWLVFRSALLGWALAGCVAGWVPLMLTTVPSDLLKLNSFPGLNVLFGDCDLSWPLGGAAEVAVNPAVAPTATAGSFFISGDFRNFRNPGSFASPPVGDWAGERDVLEENFPCRGMICFSFITLLFPSRELGLFGLSPGLPPVDLSWWCWWPSDLWQSLSWRASACSSAWRWSSSSSRRRLSCCWKCCWACCSCFWIRSNRRATVRKQNSTWLQESRGRKNWR